MQPEEVQTMRIAVPFENGSISQHYGRTECFKLYDTEDGRITGEELVKTDGRGHFYMVQFLVNHNVNLVLCTSLGGPAASALDIAGIGVVKGAEGDADAAVRDYLSSQQ